MLQLLVSAFHRQEANQRSKATVSTTVNVDTAGAIDAAAAAAAAAAATAKAWSVELAVAVKGANAMIVSSLEQRLAACEPEKRASEAARQSCKLDRQRLV
jgi:hypothetical protein